MRQVLGTCQKSGGIIYPGRLEKFRMSSRGGSRYFNPLSRVKMGKVSVYEPEGPSGRCLFP